MSQAQGVDIAALISQLEDDYNIFGHHFISRMKHSPQEKFGQMELFERHLYKRIDGC